MYDSRMSLKMNVLYVQQQMSTLLFFIAFPGERENTTPQASVLNSRVKL